MAIDRIFALRDFLSDVDRTNKNMFGKSNIKPVSLYLTATNTHFMERAEERKVDLSHMGTALKRLMKEHVCELLFMFKVQEQRLRDGEKLSPAFHVSVIYKSVQIILNGRLNGRMYTLTPKTTLDASMKPSVDYVINIKPTK